MESVYKEDDIPTISLKAFHIKCCKILNKAIKEAKSSITVDLLQHQKIK
jgi:hypothetical protein